MAWNSLQTKEVGINGEALETWNCAYRGNWQWKSQWLGCKTFLRWQGPGQWTTGASLRPWPYRPEIWFMSHESHEKSVCDLFLCGLCTRTLHQAYGLWPCHNLLNFVYWIRFGDHTAPEGAAGLTLASSNNSSAIRTAREWAFRKYKIKNIYRGTLSSEFSRFK